MKILEMTLMPGQPGRRVVALARFDLALTDDVRLYSLRLMRAEDGLKVFAPSVTGGGNAVSFAPNVRAKIIAVASETYEGLMNAEHANAA